MIAPLSLQIRSYQVGFGDCFLLSFRYPDAVRHVLMDFGSTSLPKDAPKSRMLDVAKNIQAECGAEGLTAVVATHRHKDHISGFDPGRRDNGPGAIIRALAPKLVVQPWTEDPDLEPDATAPALRGDQALQMRQVVALEAMHAVADLALLEARRSRFFTEEAREELKFLGDDNIRNRAAVENLMAMGKVGKAVYAAYGTKSGLEDLLPGVRVHVLGPPTIRQSKAVLKQASVNADEYWHLQARGLRTGAAPTGNAKSDPLFPNDVAVRTPQAFPVDQRWFVRQVRRMRQDQLLGIVRRLDDVLNNTSLILLFEINGKFLLFPGDAQFENWAYALSRSTVRNRLAKVDVYKVGHHGSLNATPKQLWRLFSKKKEVAEAVRMVSLMSTMAGKHGHEKANTEVPRSDLVAQLERETRHFSTQSLASPEFFHDTEVDLT